jgi:hypothetical protein
MSRTRCRILAPALAAFVAFTLTGGALAEELIGKVKSVDIDAKSIVVTEDATKKDSVISIGSQTSWIKEKKGKVAKKFDLSKLKVGSNIEVTREGSLASKVLIKAGKKKKKAKDA